MLKRRGTFGGKEYPHSVATTWSLSFAQVEQADPVASDILRLCAFLHPDAIPEEMLANRAIGQCPGLYSIAGDPIRLDAAIGTLRRFSLVWRNAETKMLTIHRLLQAVLRDAMTKESEQEWAERVVKFVSQAFPGEESTTWQQFERYLPQALACVELIERWEMQSSEAAQLLSKAGYHLYERGQYAEAEVLMRRALDIRERVYGQNHPDVANSLHNLALLFVACGKLLEAEAFFQDAIVMREKTLGPSHRSLAETLIDMARLLSSQSRYAEAKSLYGRALAIYRHTYGTDHPDLAPLSAEYSDILKKSRQKV
jgi:tetratricopeptide (TPR) repeat protein